MMDRVHHMMDRGTSNDGRGSLYDGYLFSTNSLYLWFLIAQELKKLFFQYLILSPSYSCFSLLDDLGSIIWWIGVAIIWSQGTLYIGQVILYLVLTTNCFLEVSQCSVLLALFELGWTFTKLSLAWLNYYLWIEKCSVHKDRQTTTTIIQKYSTGNQTWPLFLIVP